MPTPAGMQKVIASPKFSAEEKAAAQAWLDQQSKTHTEPEKPEARLERELAELSAPTPEDKEAIAKRQSLQDKRTSLNTQQHEFLNEREGVDPMVRTVHPGGRAAAVQARNPLTAEEDKVLAAAGDPQAVKSVEAKDTNASLAAGVAAAPFMGGGSALAAAIRAGLGGMVGGGTHAAMRGQPAGEVAKEAGVGGASAMLMNEILGLPFRFARGRAAAIRDPAKHPDIAPPLNAAEKEGRYETSVLSGMKPVPEKGGKNLGPAALEDEASKLATETVIPGVQKVDKKVTDTASDAMREHFAKNPDANIDIEPYMTRLREVVAKRQLPTLEGKSIPMQGTSNALADELAKMETTPGMVTAQQLEQMIDEMQTAGNAAKVSDGGTHKARMELASVLQSLRSQSPGLAEIAGSHAAGVKNVRNMKKMTGITDDRIDQLESEPISLAKTRPAEAPDVVPDKPTVVRTKNAVKNVGPAGNKQLDEELDNLANHPESGPEVKKAIEEFRQFRNAERLRDPAGDSGFGGPKSMLTRFLIKGGVHTDPIWRTMAKQSGEIRTALSAAAGTAEAEDGSKVSTSQAKRLAKWVREN